jgi:hypothetical protein
MEEQQADQKKPELRSDNKGCGCGSFGGKK